MQITSIHLISFRAHVDSALRFKPKINLIYGPNGAGKTNVLEAIHFLALSKSFLASNDRYALRKGSRFFEVNASFSGTHRSRFDVRIAYVPEEGKKMFVNQSPLEKLSQVVGMIPVVVFSPADYAITAEGPEVRRRFLNNILSQARPVYLEDMLQYRRVVRQRDALLGAQRNARMTPSDVMASWDAELVKLGSRVIASRTHFIESFKAHLEEAYERIDAVGEHPSITYKTIAPLHGVHEQSEIEEAFLARLRQLSRRERELGRTLVGPHRDELVFRINDMDVRRYASQGQHRTFGMALKLAQFFYLQSVLEEVPILLLDDLFGSLDASRTRIFLELLQTDAVGQCIITATDRKIFDNTIDFDAEWHKAIRVEKGKVDGLEQT